MLEGATEHTFIYIAGPMTGYPNYNYEAFHAVEKQLRDMGHQWINNPATHFDGRQDLSWEVYIAKAIDVVLNSEAIVVLPGWMDSPGARLEIAVATAIGHAVYSAIEDTPGSYRYVLRDVGDTRSLVRALMGIGAHPLIPPTHETQNSKLPHEEAAFLVHGDRQADYGHPLDDFSKTALIWTGILADKLQAPIEAREVPLLMLGVKLSREQNRLKRDNIVDAHGYLMTYQMVLDEAVRRAQA